MTNRRDGARWVPLRIRLVRAPLWARLVAGTLLLVAVALVLTGLLGTRMLRGYLTDKVDQQLQFASHVRVSQQGGTPASSDQNGGRLPPDEQRARRLMGSYSVILNADGTTAEQVADPFTDDRPALPVLSAAGVAGLHGHPFTVGSVGGRGGRWRVVARSEQDGRIRVVALSLAEGDGTVARLALIDAGVGAVVLACLALAGYVLVRVSLRPLVEIEDTAEAIAAGDLTRRVPDRAAPAEVTRLGGALNGMLAQIESAFLDRESSAASALRSEDRMRRFVADASHELRTPLTSIRGFAELYRQEIHGRDAADPEAAKVLRRIEEEASRMGLLVEDLLLLARMDQQRPLETRPVDLLSLAAGAVLDAQALAPDREIDLIRLDGSDSPVTVIGDEVRLRQVITNLITNALTHTPAGTSFRVGVGVVGRRDGGPAGEGGRSVVLEVADEGPGLPAGQVERVFERFYRAEPSRSRAHGGSGLGLSIVVALVQAHGGSVELETAPGEGAVFRVVLRGV